jgi:LacI family transcriptional regulator
MVATIKDIANRAGVSIATVSRVLNKKDRVKDETREKILKVIDSIGYTPNSAAKRLRENSITTVAVVVPDISASFYAEIIKGVENKANEMNCRLIVCDAQNNQEKEREYIKFLYDGSADGMIFVVPQLPDAELQKIEADGLSIVIFGKDMTACNINSISVDNFTGAYQATRHLYSHGYQRIAYIGGIVASNDYDHQARLAGYRKVLQEFNLEENPEYIENGNYCEEGGSSAFMRLMKLSPGPDAIFCANDEMALGVMKVAKKNGIKIPQDIGLIGFDNIRISQYTSPTLTTVNQPTYTIGILLSERLIFKLNNKESNIQNSNLVLKPELIIRESCGC